MSSLVSDNVTESAATTSAAAQKTVIARLTAAATFRASSRLLRFTGLWAASSLLPIAALNAAPALSSQALTLWFLCAVALGLALLVDIVVAIRAPAPHATRLLPAAFSLHQPHKITLRWPSDELPRYFEIADHHPNDDADTGLPKVIHKSEKSVTAFSYSYQPSARGKAHFGDIELWIPGPLGLIWRRIKQPSAVDVPVYPDFSVLERDALKAQHESKLDPGVRQQQRRGEGFEFHQLREYNSSDSLRQVDWKASARRRKLISREYQEEQNQQIIIMLDGGERLAMAVNGLRGFDHALNATLLLAWSAVKQHDKPGVLLFSNEQPCWIPPVRGQNGVNRILNALYTMQPGKHASDYSKAARLLLSRWHKRSLIVMLTRLQPDDEAELMSAVKLLSKRHLVLIADIQLPEQQAIQQRAVRSIDDALLISSDAGFQEARRGLYARLRHAGAMVADSTPEHLPARLNQIYLTLKRSGRI
ncbi:MAG: DUF58 domain-containing protein [Gammaproteobacteria bacterium]|jgi:uncharacterized protein (DUF58 family)|nr:DUF58 domain-containing protein [Gammaproteobacteria bacterium]MBQ0773652.1 DUF58 domain-containing protein [Gammaproteobacteria bacterium]|tara:strand:- start:74919 stop:76346 length:1428 start_codon:yes stop_codon:yes gene_type:complete